MLKLIFFDRDGVLNKELGGYTSSVELFEVLPHVVPNLKRLAPHNLKYVVVTNQSGIAKGLYTHQILSDIHQKLINELEAHQLKLEDIYYCPHHPDFSLCICRKPQSGMIEKALAQFGVKPHEAIMIGDTPRDVEAAEAVGVKAYKIDSNQNWDFVLDEIEANSSANHTH
jgi:D-glycero-D-manno-heptose 1,7-bisphosphate phosphatase